MPKTDPRVDAYIAKSADFAKPILIYVRSVVHAACPDIDETMKWNIPHFTYKGTVRKALSTHSARATRANTSSGSQGPEGTRLNSAASRRRSSG